MTGLLVFKEMILKFYQKYSLVLNPLFRFIAGFIAFHAANMAVGYNPALTKVWIEAALGLVLAAFPTQMLIVAVSAFVVVQIAFVSKYLAFTIAATFAVLYFVYVKFLPKHGFAIMAMPILYALNLPYVEPVVMGLFSTPISIAPMGIGVAAYYLIIDTNFVIGTSSEDSIGLYKMVVGQFASDTQMYISIIVFAAVMLVVYFIRNLKVNYAFEISIAAGTVLNIAFFLTMNFFLDTNMNIAGVLTGAVASSVIAWIMLFFRISLNYSGVENLQFEDEEYYYYVRAVPKMSVSAAKKRVRRYNPHHGAAGNGAKDPEKRQGVKQGE